MNNSFQSLKQKNNNGQSGSKDKTRQNNGQQSNNKSKQHHGLNLSLRRYVEAKRYPVIAKVTFKRERKDLISLLKAFKQQPNRMPQRLISYVEREGLWNNDSACLTVKGQEVVDTGLIEIAENGLYHIWYTDNDPLLGTQPLLIQRDTAFFEPNTKGWKSGADARSSDFAVSNSCEVQILEETANGHGSKQSLQKLKLTSLKPSVLCSSDASASIEFDWVLGLNKSTVSLKGKLDILSFANNKTANKLSNFNFEANGYYHLDSLLHSIAKEFNGHWHEQNNRLLVNVKEIQKYPQAIQQFVLRNRIISTLSTQYGVFQSVQIDNLDIKPEDKQDANEWHQAWLNHFHKIKYSSSAETHKQQSQWLDHDAINEFDLDLKLGQTLLDSIGREQQPKAYWHVAAIEDLSPSNSKQQKLPFTLMNSEQQNLDALMKRLTSNETIKQVIYSDRYVHTSKHLRNLQSIASYFDNAEGLLLTLNPEKISKSVDFPEHWSPKVIKKENDNHGRYWVFIGDTHTWCWECTSGLDFINQQEHDFIVDGTPGFTPKEEVELPKYLQNTICKLLNVGVM